MLNMAINNFNILGYYPLMKSIFLLSYLPFLAQLSRKIFFSKTAWPIKSKFYVEPQWVGGTKVCSRHLGHMTKMGANYAHIW